MPAEGKSVVSVNLARALSVDHLGKTLIIDCDLRRPTVHNFFRISREPGLSDGLATKKLSSNLIRSVGPGLDVITAGTPVIDPAQTLEQPDLTAFLAQLRRYYRYIIIDAPPVLFCPEPITLSCLADSALMVVRAGRTDKRMVRDAVEVIGEQKVMGIVFNDGLDPSRQYMDYSYYGYYNSASKGR
jgi:tyrosine-protein kinase Etk/Wzc